VDWYGEPQAPGMLDAERISPRARTRVAAGAQPVRERNADKFPDKPPPDAPGDEYDDEAFLYLVENEFVDVPTELRNAIDKFRHLQRDGERTRNELSSAVPAPQDARRAAEESRPRHDERAWAS
jgi:hypothetical protein